MIDHTFKRDSEFLPTIMFEKEGQLQIMVVIMNGEEEKDRTALVIRELITQGVPELTFSVDSWGAVIPEEERHNRRTSVKDIPGAFEQITCMYYSLQGEWTSCRRHKDGEFTQEWESYHSHMSSEGRFCGMFRKAQEEMGRRGLN